MNAQGAIRLPDYLFTSADLCRMADLEDSVFRNWVARKTLPPIGTRFAGRFMFNLLDALRVAATNDLVTKASLQPAVAVQMAELVVREVAKRALDGIADVNSVPRTLFLAVTWIDGQAGVAMIDPAAPGGRIYSHCEGEWSQPHVVLPLSGLVQRVFWSALEILSSRQGAAA